MKTARFFFRLLAAFLAKFKVLLGLGILMGILLFVVLKLILPRVIYTSSQSIGVTGRYEPATLPQSILGLISTGLTKTNDDGSVTSAIAQSWKYEDDGKTWIFTLKEDLVWQDNKKITSESINFNFQDVNIEKPDAQKLIFRLETPYSAFPAVVSKPVFKKGLLGNGEWKVAKLSLAGGQVEKLVLVDKQKNRITYKFYPTEEAAKTAFKLGEVKKIIDIVNPEPFDAWNGAKLQGETNFSRFAAIFFNNKDALLSDKNLRQALSYAIDKDSFNAQRAYSPISPLSWAYNPQVKTYDYNPDRARAIIEDLPKEIKDKLAINLATTPFLLDTAEQIARYWEEVGVKTHVSIISTLSPDYQTFLAIYDIPKDPDQYATWHSTQTATNISNFSDPRIDKLLEDARVELDQGERRKLYIDFQRFLLEDAPAIFLFHPVSYTISRK